MNEHLNNSIIFTGTAHPNLAGEIAAGLTIPIGKAEVRRFSDGEISVEIGEHVRGVTAFVIQPTCAPANDNLMELLILCDALRRASVRRIIAVVPYWGYARQDRRPGLIRSPITSRLVADMIGVVGVSQLIVCDIHSEQQQGFFNIPVINMAAAPIIVADIWKNYQSMSKENDTVIVSPDAGGVQRARIIAKQANNADLAIIDKRRQKANESEVMNVIGNVEGKTCILIDDMIDTAGTLCKAAKALKENGAKNVVAYATHGIFSGKAFDNISCSKLDDVVVTNTIPVTSEKLLARIRILSVAGLIAETMRRIKQKRSVSEIYVGG